MLLFGFVVALVGSVVLTRWTRDVALTRRWVSQPTLSRHVHRCPVPRLGGVAVFLSLWITVLFAFLWQSHFGLPDYLGSRFLVAIVVPCAVIFATGLIDDCRGLSAGLKCAAETFAAALLYWNGLGITVLPGHGGLTIGWPIGLPLTILWVLWITNAFNLIDGLDGLAAGSALFSALVACAVALVHNQCGIVFLTVTLAGAITGFLRYNFNPATIFLGDCGSLTIGFLLSALAIAGSEKSPTLVAVAIPVVSLGLPIIDVAITVIRRLVSGRGLFSADREHIHHKLLSLGVSHRRAVLVLYGVSACFALVSLMLLSPNNKAVGAVLVVLAIGVLVGIQHLRYHELFELERVANRTFHQRHIIANNLRIRRAADAFSDCDSFDTLCRMLKECLQPIGFDGFGLICAGDSHPAASYSLRQRSNGSVYLFWSSIKDPEAAEWTLSFFLTQRDGESEGKLTLYRSDGRAPLLADVNVFTSAGFTNNLAHSLHVLRKSHKGVLAISQATPRLLAASGD